MAFACTSPKVKMLFPAKIIKSVAMVLVKPTIMNRKKDNFQKKLFNSLILYAGNEILRPKGTAL